MKFHEPVMLNESIQALNIKAGGTYVDSTFGGGGHSREILKHLENGRLFAFDQDIDSGSQALKDERFVFINQNFRFIGNYLTMHEAGLIDGLIADLGISSHQIDLSERGFAFRLDSPLDMRMQRDQKLTGEIVVNEYPEKKLAAIFGEYGELPNAGKLAKKITEQRKTGRITRSFQLIECIESYIGGKKRNKFLAQLFQAIRIEVNGELDALKDLLNQCTTLLKNDGRIVFITYHSLEDRLVKNFLKAGNFTGEVVKDFYGNVIRPFDPLTRKPILPSAEEIQKNNRARSAKLRVAKRNEHGENTG